MTDDTGAPSGSRSYLRARDDARLRAGLPLHHRPPVIDRRDGIWLLITGVALVCVSAAYLWVAVAW